MEIQEIKRRFDLLRKVNNDNYCLISELAKELKISKTDLMQFIEDNRNLFSLVALKKHMKNGTIKNIGTALREVYLNVDENPKTDEWLKKQIEQYKNYIYVSEINYYGSIQGYYVDVDNENCKNRENLWRNTKEKIDKLIEQNIVSEYTFCIGGYNDCYNRFCKFALLGDWENKLLKNGWKFNTIKK